MNLGYDMNAPEEIMEMKIPRSTSVSKRCRTANTHQLFRARLLIFPYSSGTSHSERNGARSKCIAVKARNERRKTGKYSGSLVKPSLMARSSENSAEIPIAGADTR